MNLCDIREIRALLTRHGFHFSKSMGQNFLIDPSIPPAIAEASGADRSSGVLEIGPGVGPLTAELSRRAGKVVAVELDRSLLPVLAETLADCPNVEVISGDVMKLDLGALVREKFGGLSPIVCSNLPYNITTPVLTRLAKTPRFQSVTVLIQREVARRVCAAPGDADCGAFSLIFQYFMEASLLFDVPPGCFFPAPKVTSSVIRCVRRENPAVRVEDEDFFFRILRGAFSLRRKTLVNSLSSLPGFDKPSVSQAVKACGLPPDIRGERLSLQNFSELSSFLLRNKK
jgi:16S rRNA (adenine1518-N6/adenine1519-N6)-dimethyltransferase